MDSPSCEKFWVYKGHRAESWQPWKKKGPSFHPAKTMPAAPTNYTIFALPISLLHHPSTVLCRNTNPTKTSGMLVFGLTSPWSFWEWIWSHFPSLYFQKPWQPKAHPTKAAILAVLPGIPELCGNPNFAKYCHPTRNTHLDAKVYLKSSNAQKQKN